MLQVPNNLELMARKLTLIQIVDNMDDRDSQVKYLLLQKKSTHVNMNTGLCTSAADRHKQSSKTALLPLKATKTQASQISSYKLYIQRHSLFTVCRCQYATKDNILVKQTHEEQHSWKCVCSICNFTLGGLGFDLN